MTPSIVSTVAVKVLGHRLILKGDKEAPYTAYPDLQQRNLYDSMEFGGQGNLPFQRVVREIVGDDVWGGGKVKPPK
jgi:hypothetical protein